MINSQLYNQILWITPYGDRGPEDTLPGYGALVFMAPCTTNTRLVLLVENPLDQTLNLRNQLPIVMNGMVNRLLRQNCLPEQMLWYSCIDRRFDRVVPNWHGRFANGDPLPPELTCYPCGNRSIGSFMDICKAVGIDTARLLQTAEHYGIALQD
jgi:hypothetical protein